MPGRRPRRQNLDSPACRLEGERPAGCPWRVERREPGANRRDTPAQRPAGRDWVVAASEHNGDHKQRDAHAEDGENLGLCGRGDADREGEEQDQDAKRDDIDEPVCGDGPRDDTPVLLRVCEPSRVNPDLREFSGSTGEDRVHELSQQVGAFCRVGAGCPPAQGP